MSGNSDEPVYVYQARMLAEGRVTLAAQIHGQFFHPWLFGQRGDRLFSQYQPGWPAVIAFAHVLGDERVALVIAAVAAVGATWVLAQQVAPGSGAFSAALLLISPIFVVQAGLYLSYLWTAALVAAGLACMVAGARQRRPVTFAVSGAVFGIALLTRPFDALIVAAGAGIYALIILRSDRLGLRRAILWTTVGGLPSLVLTALYNAHVTGSPSRFPLQAADRLDTFGFGKRTLALGEPLVNYTPRVALSALSHSALSMPHWFAGGGVGLVLACIAVVRHRRRLEAWLLVAMVAVFPIEYFFWWATSLAAPGAAKGLGPEYYVPAFTFLAVLAGWEVRDIASTSRAAAGCVLAVVAIGSLFMLPTIIHNGHLTTRLQRAKAAPLTASTLTKAVVVMRADPSSYTLKEYPFLVGDPRLSNSVLYAVDRGPASAELAQQFPTRKLYQFIQQTQPGEPLLKPSYLVERLHIVTGSAVTLRFSAMNPSDQSVVVASVQINGRSVATKVLSRDFHAGATVRFDVMLSETGRIPRPRPDLLAARVATNGQVLIDVAFGPDVHRDRADIFERRYFVARIGKGLAVQTPGLQYHRFAFGHVVWVRQNVEQHLAERPANWSAPAIARSGYLNLGH